MKGFRIVQESSGQEISTRAWLADKPWSRMKGLLGRKGLADGEAIILRPCSSIHTFFMRFPLDVVFLDREQRVVKVVRALKAHRLAAAKGARDAIEMEAGSMAGFDLKPGDRLRLEPLD